MAGLSLGVGGYGGYGGASVPQAANAPSSTISQAAFGINTGLSAGPATAGLGTMGLGVAMAAVLWFVWYSLPR